MFYSLVVLIFGIYLGQEYPGIPCVKTTYLKTLKYLKNEKSEETNDVTSEPTTSPKSLSELIKNMLNKKEKEN